MKIFAFALFPVYARRVFAVHEYAVNTFLFLIRRESSCSTGRILAQSWVRGVKLWNGWALSRSFIAFRSMCVCLFIPNVGRLFRRALQPDIFLFVLAVVRLVGFRDAARNNSPNSIKSRKIFFASPLC